MAQTFSFDVTSNIEMPEVDNAVNQARKEIGQRFDFKGSSAAIDLDQKANTLTLTAEDSLDLPRLSVSTRIRAHEVTLRHLVFADATVTAPLLGLRATTRICLSACTFVDNAVTARPGGRLIELTATGPTEAVLEGCWLLSNHAASPGNALIGFEALPPAHFEAVTLQRVALPKEVPPGSGSVSTTPSAGWGPLFVATSV